MGKLLGIARRAKTHAPMEELQTVAIASGTGLEGDSRGKMEDRNVTVLSAEVWDAVCGELGADLPWTTRRSNLLVGGIGAA